ncbi:MAG: hypothetical protein KKE37_12690 [Verrucomicrobia bacterium]|nr:hypothetical protein [Verrucomicrobiota bacterium]MBU4290352.1 hypothetical protein [Verrucomicrobiota bacterium]MBU4430196.1 hypothetical protein [Verrucomicrobiota bacterium]MCG2681482.1 hypothetical protein [Kiritimatiellia bacterium]
MQLTDEQKLKVKQWVAEGCGLSEIQQRLRDEDSLALTFMDVRFLVLDMGIEMKERVAPKSSRPIELDKAAAEPALADEGEPPGNEAPAGGGVAVEIDRVMKPGAMVSGTVKFSDGVSAAWSLDQFGRLGLNMARQDYRPSPEDLKMFQQELTRLIQSRGM